MRRNLAVEPGLSPSLLVESLFLRLDVVLVIHYPVDYQPYGLSIRVNDRLGGVAQNVGDGPKLMARLWEPALAFRLLLKSPNAVQEHFVVVHALNPIRDFLVVEALDGEIVGEFVPYLANQDQVLVDLGRYYPQHVRDSDLRSKGSKRPRRIEQLPGDFLLMPEHEQL